MKILGLSLPEIRWPFLSAKASLRQLFEAIEAGDVPAARRQLERTSNPEVISEAQSAVYGTGAHRLSRGEADLMDALIDAGHVTMLDRALFLATYAEKEAVAMRLLERGADPMFEERLSKLRLDPLAAALPRRPALIQKHPRPQTAFDMAGRLPSSELMVAIAARLTQVQLDRLLPMYVREDKARHVRALIGAGADAMQRVGGLTLLEIAPEGAEEVKRMLRSVETRAMLESAMGSSDDPLPTAPSLVL